MIKFFTEIKDFWYDYVISNQTINDQIFAIVANKSGLDNNIEV